MSIRPRISFEFVKPKLGADVANIGLTDAVLNPFNLSYSSPPANSSVPPSKRTGSVWQEFALGFSLGDSLSKADLNNLNNFLKNVNVIITKMTDLLKIIILLSNDLLSVGRALKFAIKTIVTLLKNFIESFESTGLYWCLVTPDKHEKDHTFIVPTWGNFEEFKRKITAACLDINNPTSPANLNINTTVGGLVIGGIFGKNDPKAVDAFIYNMQLLGKFFDFFDASVTGSPKGVKAVGGIYNQKLGIKISWNKASSDFVTGYRVYRCQTKSGVFPTFDQLQSMMTGFFKPGTGKDIEVLSKIKTYDNDINTTIGKNFNGGNPVTVLATPGTQSYSIVDTDVTDGVNYYYIVFSIPGLGELIFNNPYNIRVDSPLASPAVGAKAFGCIPISEISQGILSKEGDFIDEKNLKYKWNFLTLRKFLGPVFDKQVFGTIDLFADKLLGLVSTSSDSINNYLTFFGKKIQSYIQILNTIVQIVEILVNFRLRGSVLLLNVPASKGGIQYFTNTVTNSSVTSDTFTGTGSTTNNGGAALETIEGFYFGWVVVYGISDSADYSKLAQPYRAEYNNTISQLQASQKAIDTLTKLLVG